MGPFFRRHRELLTLALLLSAPFVVYIAHADVESVPGPVRRAVVWVTSPVQRVLVWTVSTTQDVWYGYADLRGTHARNLELLARSHRLATADSELAELRSENARLRRLASYADSRSDTRLLAAPVIAWGPDARYKSVRIGRGGNDGLQPGMPVVTPDGLVGRVSNVFGDTADVLLVTDPSSAVAAMTQRSRARTSIAGIGNSKALRLDYLGRNEDVEDGDILVTSNAGGLYPKGLRVGRAIRVQSANYGLFKSAELEPSVDFSRLEEVQVIMDAGPSAAVYVPGATFVQ